MSTVRADCTLLHAPAPSFLSLITWSVFQFLFSPPLGYLSYHLLLIVSTISWSLWHHCFCPLSFSSLVSAAHFLYILCIQIHPERIWLLCVFTIIFFLSLTPQQAHATDRPTPDFLPASSMLMPVQACLSRMSCSYAVVCQRQLPKNWLWNSYRFDSPVVKQSVVWNQARYQYLLHKCP